MTVCGDRSIKGSREASGEAERGSSLGPHAADATMPGLIGLSSQTQSQRIFLQLNPMPRHVVRLDGVVPPQLVTLYGC